MASSPSAELSNPSTGLLGPDPGPMIRCWVALILRVGVGLTLLSSGLSSYFRAQSSGGVNFLGAGPSFSMLDPFLSGLPYLSIALGLALILGFLTTVSAIAAACFSLILPFFSIVMVVANGGVGGMNPGGRWPNDPFLTMAMSMSLANLLTHAALIWLSPLANHPYSIDALIFGRNALEPSEFRVGVVHPVEPLLESAAEETHRIEGP